MDFSLDSIEIKKEKLIDPEKGNKINFKHINVFIGSNNCGKTEMLKEIMSQFDKDSKQSQILIDSGKSEWTCPDDLETLLNKYAINYTITGSNDLSIHTFYPTFESTPSHDCRNYRVYNTKKINENLKSRNFNATLKEFGISLVTFLKTDNRLTIVPVKESINAISNIVYPNDVIESILVSNNKNNIILEISKDFKSIFNDDIWLIPSFDDGIGFRYHANENDAQNYASSTQSMGKCDMDFVNNQGDGMRAALNMLCAIIAVKKPIILLDEPETFLHPGQAYAFGKSLNKIIDKNTQLFVSTHNADFLRGLLANHDSNDCTVIRFDRFKNDKISFNILDANDIKEVSKDKFMSSLRVLDGLFRSGCIVCEGDKDAIIYQSILNLIEGTNDFSIIPTTGASGLTKTSKLYRDLNVRHALILDCDAILTCDDLDKPIRCRLQLIFNDYVTDTNNPDMVKLNKDLNLINNCFTKNSSGSGCIKKNERDCFKGELKKFLGDHHVQDIYDDICSICAKYGIFLTQEGELESWFVNKIIHNQCYTCRDSKDSRYEKLLDIVFNEDEQTLQNSSLGIFVKNIVKYLKDQP